jgi:hypothetical protein
MVRIAAAAALAATSALTGATAAAATEPATAQGDYVAALLARAQADSPYSAGDDYVDTLVYWHHNPNWGIGS